MTVTASPTLPTSGIDPITFEVIQHRLWAINNEATATLKFVSGSPVATEVYDFNTSILNAQGEAIVVGPYMASHAICQGLVVQTILAECQDNPGIGPGDVFLCSDPYSGAIHQNDVAIVTPIFANGELIAWTGATIHENDVGGGFVGSQASLGAQSIYEEAPPIPAIKLVEAGRLRRDLEREVLIRSRTPESNALDMRAMLAANVVAGRRIEELLGKYGADVLTRVMQGIADHAAARMRALLRELPDGTWRHTSYIDFRDDIFACRVVLTKDADSLTLDYSDSSLQAPALINCAYSGLVAGAFIAVLTQLCWDIPWSPAGVMQPVHLLSKPGTFVHSKWPAGVAKATTAASFVLTTATCVVLAKMLAASEKHADRSMAPWTGAVAVQESFGVDQRGEPYGTTLLDDMGGGGGARSFKDGIDTGGLIRTLSTTLANVETYEYRYPILYLYRRQEADTGGAGKFRGGVGIGKAYVPHDVQRIPNHVMHATGAEEPESVGIYGGYPGSTNTFTILRNSDVVDQFARGVLPQDLDEMTGELEPQPALKSTVLGSSDVFRSVTAGGGGYGDPLERDPALVARDVANGLVSVECGEALYGVVLRIEAQPAAVDVEATRARRDALRAART
jgi:N-methylhydantoinase B